MKELPTEMLFQKAHLITEQVGQVILGKEQEVAEVMLAFLAGGHILLEDIPGVGKTTLALAFSKALGLEYKRVQFTPDLMPSDLTGFSIYRREEERFVYQQGSVFCNLLLADEINRTSSKTQSALLEAMEEKQCTVDGITRRLEAPFLVIATQNPYESAGTQLLPDAQMDRFMISMSMGYPDYDSELKMIKALESESRLQGLQPVITKDVFLKMQEEIRKVYISEAVYRYILDLVTNTRNLPELEKGASPRASIALTRMARASAWYAGRDYVLPGDVRRQFSYVTAHRIIPGRKAGSRRANKTEVLNASLEQVKEPMIGVKKR
jgi:MoxR-like ATPase